MTEESTIKHEVRVSRLVTKDLMTIILTINYQSDKSAVAVSNVDLTTEALLEKLVDFGLTVDKIKQVDNNVSPSYRGEAIEFQASRRLEFDLEYSGAAVNTLNDILKELDSTVYMETHYKLSNSDEILQELASEALNKSKEQVAKLAETLGKKIVGVKSIDYSDESYGVKPLVEDMMLFAKQSGARMSDGLKAQEENLSVSLIVEWQID